MTKAELTKIVQTVVREELKRSLPKMIRETLGDLLLERLSTPAPSRKNVIGKSRSSKQTTPQPASRPAQPKMDKASLIEAMGYGGYSPERTYEQFDNDEDAAKIYTPIAVDPPSPVATIVGVPMSGGLGEQEALMTDSVPVDVMMALGRGAKNVLEEVNKRTNFRPGK